MAIFHSRLKELELLSQLALGQRGHESVLKLLSRAGEAGEEQRRGFYRLSHEHHVVIRALQPLQQQALEDGHSELSDSTESMLAMERGRIANSLEFLYAICRELEDAGCPTIVIKSLDHWPDLGNDLDLYTAGDKRSTASVMSNKFHAT